MRPPEYLAGVFDGEGMVAVKRNGAKKSGGYYYGATVRVGMCCLPVLQSFQARFSGGIYSGGRMRNDAWAPSWIWTLAKRSDVYNFLLTVSPWLIEKRQQALTAIEYLERIEAHGSKALDHEAYYLALRQQKRVA